MKFPVWDHRQCVLASRRLFVFSSAVLLVLAAPGPANAKAAGQWHGPDEIFAQVCGLCHTTGVGPELRGRHLDQTYVIGVVRRGLRAMPAFPPTEFSDTELAALADMIAHSAAPQAPAQGASP